MRGLLYQLLIHLALPLVLWRTWRRCRQAAKTHPALKSCFAEKFGAAAFSQQGGILIHAVSLGETRSILPLLRALQQTYPDLPITLTNGSVRGAKQLVGNLPPCVEHAFLPLDYPFAVKRFLQRLQPQLVLVVETEIWPNLINACHQQQIPIAMINARLKQGSMQRYQKWGGAWLTQQLNKLAWIGCQFSEDQQHFAQLGLPLKKLPIQGNLKFDLDVPTDLAEQTNAWRKKTAAAHPNAFIWVAASTHPGEEALLLDVHRQLQEALPALHPLLILVPRQAERFNQVATLLHDQDWRFIRRSSLHPMPADCEVYLADSVGEMLLWFALADAAFIGGSLVPFGGHNILEPAAVKTAVLSGPYHHNLQALYSLMQRQKAVVIVQDSNDLSRQLQFFAQNTTERQQQAEHGYQAFCKYSGALPKLMQAIETTLPNHKAKTKQPH
ncbi:MAG: 3-deoxy-D-manno-octulosonic acid transferase [Thiotrichales bacterium]|nr:3-deoxy-D-manno-octulosonic acid transferase [Thiotrichales bacterium]